MDYRGDYAPTAESFENVLEERLVKIEEVLSSKAREYASGRNRYHNFDIAARVADTSPEEALWGMATKHLISVMDLVESTKKNGRINPELVDEKIGDMINYLILLEGLLYRRAKNQ